ncbi:hypothetical protein STM14_1593 [Salmonella enterica subsp. enterica serovar Typhimurium str. 14028S]|uniref:Uncharacterized protein n=1 Tax=Salmonella typhimurium (strain 14028s / SGSC 2262) TaxID=588858 RepID=A0A0F6B0P5_SALT1|nr:hypothetical protein STM14_1593 [Salmonella enterica subsp. enterica serovar Typhimurium str. 14028S]
MRDNLVGQGNTIRWSDPVYSFQPPKKVNPVTQVAQSMDAG